MPWRWTAGPNAHAAVTPPNTAGPDGAVLSLGGGQAIKYNPEFQVNTTTTEYPADEPRNAAGRGDRPLGATTVVVWSKQ